MGHARRAHVFQLERSRPALFLVGAALASLMVGTAVAQTRTPVHRAPAEYPALAFRMRVAGTVTVVAEIDGNGTVMNAKAVAGHALLRQSAEKAVMQWKFASAAKPTSTNIDVHFDLDAAPGH